MNVYHVTFDCNPYKSLELDRRGYRSDEEYEAAFRNLEFLGKPKDPWIPPKMYPRNPMKPAPDFWMLLTSGEAFAVGPEVLETVYPFMEMAGQTLPLPLKGKELTICNVLQVYDCVDTERSQWRALPGINGPGALLKPQFIPEHMQISSLFKIPEHLHRMYCWEATGDPEDEFKACVEKHKLKGLEFELVWSDEEKAPRSRQR